MAPTTIVGCFVRNAENVLSYRRNCILATLRIHSISSSLPCTLDQKWRQRKGLTTNPNEYGPLTNLPDYSYIDGRPTPLGVGQNERMVKQRQYAETIVALTKEIDFAVERHKKLEDEKEQTRKRILESKLKPKGSLLLKP